MSALRLLHRFLDAPLLRAPDSIAIEVPAGWDTAGKARARQTLTYKQLALRSDALATSLVARTGPERIVAILLPREQVELYVAQLAALKAGAAYACIEPSLPDDYARHLVEDTQADVLLTDASGALRAAALGVPADKVVVVPQADPAAPAAALVDRATPQNLAYLIYTSGTTGRPKGVMIEHASIANLVASDLAEFALGPGDRVAQGSSPAYDSSIEETWLALAAGGTVVVLDDRVVRSGPDLLAWLQHERITVFCPPPTLLRATGCKDPRTALPDLRLLYVGGEALPEDVADLWSAGRRLENGYGPTECSVTATRCTVQASAPITIGRPVRGNTAVVLDDELRAVPYGEVGELCLGGAGVARGYRNNEQQTAERFVQHPEHGRIYRTGDLVRQDAQGNLVYLGRRDTQVKVRGHRIELEQIETRLAELPGVREAVCAVQGEGSRKSIVGFVVPSDPATPPDLEALRNQLVVLLPAPMVPTKLGLLEALPKSVGGKLDRKRLPKLELSSRLDNTEELEGMAAILAGRFAKVLGFTSEAGTASGVGLDSDFFLELGGDSLAAAELVSLLREDPRTEAITVRDLYAVRTVRGLVPLCRDTAPHAAPHASQVAEQPPRYGEPKGSPVWFTVAQTAWILAELALISALALWILVEALPWLVEQLGLGGTLVAAPLVALLAAVAWMPLALLATVVLKRVLIGRYTPGRHAAWSGWHLRHWIVARSARRIPWRLLAGTELTSIVLRLLGARVGTGVHIHRGVDMVDGGWDLLELGNYATLSQDATLHTVELSAGTLVVGPISMGDHSAVGIRTGMAPGSTLAARCVLGDLSWLEAGARTQPGELWDGVPARCQGCRPTPVTDTPLHSGAMQALASVALRAFARVVVEAPLVGAALAASAYFHLDQAALLGWLETPQLTLELVVLVGLVLVLRVPLTLLVECLLVRELTPKHTLHCQRGSFAYERIWIV